MKQIKQKIEFLINQYNSNIRVTEARLRAARDNFDRDILSNKISYFKTFIEELEELKTML